MTGPIITSTIIGDEFILLMGSINSFITTIGVYQLLYEVIALKYPVHKYVTLLFHFSGAVMIGMLVLSELDGLEVGEEQSNIYLLNGLFLIFLLRVVFISHLY